MILCIVGGDASRFNGQEAKLAKAYIRLSLTSPMIVPNPNFVIIKVISGCSPKGGVDVWAQEIAVELGYPFGGYPPTYNQWEPHGFKERNMQMAEACTHLIDIEHIGFDRPVRNIGRNANVWSGGTWTANHARELGKKVTVIGICRLDRHEMAVEDE